MKIITTGLLGFVGSRISEILGKKYEFTNISRSCGVNIKNRTQVLKYIENSDAPIVLHLAAKTNVDIFHKVDLLKVIEPESLPASKVSIIIPPNF